MQRQAHGVCEMQVAACGICKIVCATAQDISFGLELKFVRKMGEFEGSVCGDSAHVCIRADGLREMSTMHLKEHYVANVVLLIFHINRNNPLHFLTCQTSIFLVLEELAPEIPEPAPIIESDGNRVLRLWNVLLPSLVVLSGLRPKLLQEQLEDIEVWLREWAHFEKAAAEKIVVEAHTAKEKGKGNEREENPDTGKPKAGGCMSTGSKILDSPCKNCVQRRVKCTQGKNTCCGPCERSHRACNFTTKCKASEAVVVLCKVPCVAEECLPMVKPTMADDADDSGESEVEVEEPPKKAHPVPRLVKPLPVRVVAGPLWVRADNSELICLCTNNKRLQAEVDRLYTSHEDYDRFMRNINYQAQKQQQELIAMSNCLYTFSDD
ncbi:uncharacterized protein EDB93DRAFT_1255935 [Suillus bovinus]|uniref:uncharacterized protein n=1 Tax=Suillus bovinus TaxID=48563 RepID=UPI001B85D52F|nr:uncharacterized protein EDB93DRAFT_1255935 [Suillus bovinus]KAG2130319.1 hypothetical protein EDB93DRAFT_1255935 [Suillus bovinus]